MSPSPPPPSLTDRYNRGYANAEKLCVPRIIVIRLIQCHLFNVFRMAPIKTLMVRATVIVISREEHRKTIRVK